MDISVQEQLEKDLVHLMCETHNSALDIQGQFPQQYETLMAVSNNLAQYADAVKNGSLTATEMPTKSNSMW